MLKRHIKFSRTLESVFAQNDNVNFLTIKTLLHGHCGKMITATSNPLNVHMA